MKNIPYYCSIPYVRIHFKDELAIVRTTYHDTDAWYEVLRKIRDEICSVDNVTDVSFGAGYAQLEHSAETWEGIGEEASTARIAILRILELNVRRC